MINGIYSNAEEIAAANTEASAQLDRVLAIAYAPELAEVLTELYYSVVDADAARKNGIDDGTWQDAAYTRKERAQDAALALMTRLGLIY